MNNFIAYLWGFAEATLFFLIPDVWLSMLGLRRLGKGLVAIPFALAGALTGGVLVYLWSRRNFARVRGLLLKLPAINGGMMASVERELAASGAPAILLGPARGTPYKIYALHAHRHGIGLRDFALISIPARTPRFVLVPIMTHYAINALCRRFPVIKPMPTLLAGWTVFYTIYFIVRKN